LVLPTDVEIEADPVVIAPPRGFALTPDGTTSAMAAAPSKSLFWSEMDFLPSTRREQSEAISDMAVPPHIRLQIRL
jgi:hypothetical protein